MNKPLSWTQTRRLIIDANPQTERHLPIEWRSQINPAGADLTGAFLERAFLYQAFLSQVNFMGAHLRWADLSEARLQQANLNLADLREANLRGANLHWVNLIGANLAGATYDAGTRWPAATMLLLANWGKVSDKLCRDLMRFDAGCHPAPEMFNTWATMGDGHCPYANLAVQRAANFQERGCLWEPGPAPTPMNLVQRLLEEKCTLV